MPTPTARSRDVQTSALALLVPAAAGWLALDRFGAAMSGSSSALSFVAFWALMMAAMMLPSFAPVASGYLRMVRPPHGLAAAALSTGYLAVWSSLGSVALGCSRGVDALMASHPSAMRPLAASIFAVSGIYQATPLKHSCLARCRAPFSQLLEYASWRGPGRHLRVGIHYGAYCAGCCWTLMLLLFAFGLMNLGVMAVLSLAVAIEKLLVRGNWFSHALGAACVALAIAVWWIPEVAPALLSPGAMTIP